MKKIRGFTLAEIILCMIILGIIAIFMLKSLRDKNFQEKAFVLTLAKILETVDGATARMPEEKPDLFPMGSFMYDGGSGLEFVVCRSSSDCTSTYSSEDILDLYNEQIKYTKTGTFADFSGYDTNAEFGISANDIPAAMIPGNAAIGFNKYSEVKACPSNIFLPDQEKEEGEESIPVVISGNCWGEIYIDVNGEKEPNKFGEDVYIYGLDGTGTVRNGKRATSAS